MANPLDVLNRARRAALAYAKLGGKQGLLSLLTEAQTELEKRLAKSDPGKFTGAQQAAALAQIKALIPLVQKGLLSRVLKGGKNAASASAAAQLQYLQYLDERFKDVALPGAGLRTAAVYDRAVKGAESTILHRLLSDPKDPRRKGVLERYGDEVVQHFERRLQMRALTGASWADTRKSLVDGSEFLKGAPMHWAERIVRTETMSAHNRAAYDAQAEIGDQIGGGMVRILCATFDSRTSADSYAVHGQIRRMNEPFQDWTHSYMTPPNRPNDREVVVPHLLGLPIPAELKPKSDASVASVWSAEGRKGSPPKRPLMSTVSQEELAGKTQPKPKPKPVPEVAKEFEQKASEKIVPHERYVRVVEPLPSPFSPGPLPKQPKKPKVLDASDIMFTQLSGPKGSNPGGLYRGADSQERYVKLYSDPAQAVGEHVANKIYADLGLGRVKSQIFVHDGKTAYASEIIEGATPIGSNLTPELARKALEGFVGDLVTANWDAVGLSVDNLLVTKAGKIVRVDNGGTFLMRAQAGRKPEHLLDQLTEWDVFFSPKNPAYSHLADIAGVKSPADMLPSIRKQFAKLQAVAAKVGGWASYVEAAAPGADKATLDRMAKMLESRTALIGKKIAQTDQLVAEQKAAAVKAAAAAKKAAAVAVAKKAVPGIPSILGASAKKAVQFQPWRVGPATLQEAVGRLPQRDISQLWTTNEPKTSEFLERRKRVVTALKTDPSVVGAVSCYTGSGSSNIRLAERIKTGNLLPNDKNTWASLSKNDQKFYTDLADKMDLAYKRAATLPRPHEGYTLYRGVRFDDATVRQTLERSEIVFGGTGSTSFKFGKAASFAGLKSEFRGEWAVMFEITGHKSGISISSISKVGNEAEVIFGPTAKFRILNVQKLPFQRAMIIQVEEI